MDLLQQARQLEQEFEQNKSQLREFEVKQAMLKEQFIQQQQNLAQRGITFQNGEELQQIYQERKTRLEDLIQNYNQVKAQQQGAVV